MEVEPEKSGYPCSSSSIYRLGSKPWVKRHSDLGGFPPIGYGNPDIEFLSVFRFPVLWDHLLKGQKNTALRSAIPPTSWEKQKKVFPWFTGWWCFATPLKNMRSSIGMRTATQYFWENFKHDNQTTNQFICYKLHL